MADFKVILQVELEMPQGWIERMKNWVVNSLKKGLHQNKIKLQRKLEYLKKESAKGKEKRSHHKNGEKRKVVYNNSSKELSEEQIQLLSLGLNFGLTPRKFPLAEYVQATELLCQKLEEGDDDESVERHEQLEMKYLHI